VVLKQFILTKRGCADGAFVGEVGRLQGLAVVLGYVVQQLPLVDLPTHRTPTTVLALVSRVLHTGRHQAVTAQQVSLQALVSEKSELTFLTIERRSVVDHLGMNFNLVDPLHVVTELFQILDVSITDLTDDKVSLPSLALPRLARFVDGGGAAGGRRRAVLLLAGVVPPGQWSDGDTRGVGLRSAFLTQALNGDGTGLAHVVTEHHVIETLHPAD